MSKSKKNKSAKKENRKAVTDALIVTIANQLADLGFEAKKINKEVKKAAEKLAKRIAKYPKKEKVAEAQIVASAVAEETTEVAPIATTPVAKSKRTTKK